MIRNVTHFIYDDIFASQFIMIYISSGPHADARVPGDSLFLRPVPAFVRQKHLVFLLLLSTADCSKYREYPETLTPLR